ncbi:ATP-binding protein [Streptacidiphilus rugosus]|uniref:ATP-binding protein n=1 Tax=Streptacidiphilus rugosus TaxID=405783 RepID=UPI00068E78D1|nr:ATP-binding protein [Streptacidiphilus rugosus]
MTIESPEIQSASTGRVRVALAEDDWTTTLQQRHWYRCWAWRSAGSEVAGIARGLAAETLADWRLGPMSDDVKLCVSELVGNALLHGQSDPASHDAWSTPLSLGLRYFPSTCLMVEVGDSSVAPPLWTWLDPEIDPGEALFADGRGLMILREIADRVWWRCHPGAGKTVYARLDTPRYFEAPVCGEHA